MLSSGMRFSHDYSKLRQFLYLVLAAAVFSVGLAYVLGIDNFEEFGDVVLMITAPLAYIFWCLLILKVKDK